MLVVKWRLFATHVQVYILIHYRHSAVIATYFYISTDCFYTALCYSFFILSIIALLYCFFARNKIYLPFSISTDFGYKSYGACPSHAITIITGSAGLPFPPLSSDTFLRAERHSSVIEFEVSSTTHFLSLSAWLQALLACKSKGWGSVSCMI